MFIKLGAGRASGDIALRFEYPLELFPLFLYQILIEIVKSHDILKLSVRLVEVLL